jgi:hypothetical protein
MSVNWKIAGDVWPFPKSDELRLSLCQLRSATPASALHGYIWHER